MRKVLMICLCVMFMIGLCSCSSNDSSDIDSYSYAQGYVDAINSIEPEMVIEYSQEDYLSEEEYELVYTIIRDGMTIYSENAYYEYRDEIEYGE